MDRARRGTGRWATWACTLIDLLRWNFGEIARVIADDGIATPSPAPPTARTADAEDFCAVHRGARPPAREVTFTVSRAARGGNGQTVEAFGANGGLAYRLDRGARQWYRGELMATQGSGPLAKVPVSAGLPKTAGEGDSWR